MVLKILGAAYNAFFPTRYTVQIVITVVTALVLRAFSQGRATNRERDLHGRRIIVTGGFTPLGLTILQALAERGAHIIALSSQPIDSAEVSILITLLRTTFSNEHIYSEHCDLASPASIRAFCTRFLTTGSDQRIDAIIYAHEYLHIGSLKPFRPTSVLQEAVAGKRDSASLATFLITTLLLPALLVAPVERDIRIITVVNPFYAAASNLTMTLAFSEQASVTTTLADSKPKPQSLFLSEGTRSIRTVTYMRHLQRVLDALPSGAAQVPKVSDGSTSVPIISAKAQRSNIVSVSVSPGISRMDTICPLLNADWTCSEGWSYRGVILYLLLQPLFWILTKSPSAAVQTVLHALFLPTPFKLSSSSSSSGPGSTLSTDAPTLNIAKKSREEVLKPGALYAECAIVKLSIPAIKSTELSDQNIKAGDTKGKGTVNKQVLDIPQDSEFGGEVTGRAVWESYEEALKAWEKANPGLPLEVGLVETDEKKGGKAKNEVSADVYG